MRGLFGRRIGMVTDLWEKMGELEEMDSANVLAQLFTTYEIKLQNDPGDRNALQFFQALDRIIDQVDECNLNRR